jgi:hypothetical protein
MKQSLCKQWGRWLCLGTIGACWNFTSAAQWNGSKPSDSQPAPALSSELSNRSEHWAFKPVRISNVGSVSGDSWSLNPIDKFVLAQLQQRSLAPNPAAARRELIRRAYFDLIGLPPSRGEVDAFERDDSPEAFQRVIDCLLAKPAYGERWARHWLDIVRYAQTNGYERDGEKPNAWRYRDYVIRALNEDKPYDRFILEQLAGDELDPVTDDGVIATGFYRLGVWDDEPDDARMAEFESLDDVIMTTGATFLGLTVACARCHDHKFDPISQEDYYKLLAFFRNIRPYANPVPYHDSATFVPLGDRDAIATRLKLSKERTQAQREELAKTEDAQVKKRLQEEIAKIEREATGDLDWALAVRDGENKSTHVLVRGNSASPAAEVEPAFLESLDTRKPVINAPVHGGSSGRRLAVARWIASSDHPLTARVMANRIWQHHFGRGIIQSTADFGHSGVPPTHPELLDWLAAEFIAGNWSIKHLHRVIMLSQTYQMSSHVAANRSNESSSTNRHVAQQAAADADPANDHFWRQNMRRLEAEAIRDSILYVSGQLDMTPYGRGFFPHTAGEVLAAGSRPGDGWATSSYTEQSRRSIYAFVKRSMIPPFFEGFDYTNTATPLGERPTTTVAPQALMLLNDAFIRTQSRALATRIEQEAGRDPKLQIERAYALALSRSPTDSEMDVGMRYLARQANSFASLASRITFAPDVPISLHRGYMSRMQPGDFLRGPNDGWRYFRGRWGRDYEGITTLDRTCTPFAIWQGPSFSDGVITAELTLSKGAESASILFRASPEEEVFRGYEL